MVGTGIEEHSEHDGGLKAPGAARGTRRCRVDEDIHPAGVGRASAVRSKPPFLSSSPGSSDGPGFSSLSEFSPRRSLPGKPSWQRARRIEF